MTALRRKLVRDIAHMKGQASAIAVVMACGVATFVMSMSMVDSLTGTLDTYYERNRFADVFAHLKRAPVSLAERIAEIPGVGAVETRVVERVTLDMPGLAEPASGQVVSLPRDPRSGLNVVHLRSGRFPEGRDDREVLVSQRFAEAHGLAAGDRVSAVLNGRRQSLRVAGVALSPEFIYLIPPGSILPENQRYAVFWMGRDEMEAAFDMEGAFNDVVLRLTPDASGPRDGRGPRQAEVIARLDELTERYGGLGAYGREDQVSHKFLANEIRELRGMTMVVPMIFLGVAAFLLNIVLSRLIATQRTQIATLKAVGYSRVEIALHYYGFVLLIVAGALALGTAGGVWMGRGLTAMYIAFFDFPSFQFTLHPRIIVLAFAVSTAAASLGAAHALRAAMRLPPAEAMRPAAPPAYRPTVLERLGVHGLMPPSLRMVFRYLERRRLKTAMSVLGIAMAAAILVVGSYTEDAVHYLMDFQFNRVQQYDVDVVMAEETDDRVLTSIAGFQGVRVLEPYRSVAVRLRQGTRDRRTGILGLSRGDGLHQLMDMSGRRVELPASGLVLSKTLAGVLGVQLGDTLTVEVLQGRRPTFTTEVAALLDDYSGLAAYMSMDELNRLMREQHTLSGVYIAADPVHLDGLYGELHDAPQVVAVNVKSTTVAAFEESIAGSMGLMRAFFVGFSMIIACGVVYSSARISLSERSRELASLRVIGFTRREVSTIQLGELAILTAIALPVGLLLGFLFAWWASMASDSELIRIPFVIYPSTFVLAVVVVVAASVVSGLLVRRGLEGLDLVSALKAPE